MTRLRGLVVVVLLVAAAMPAGAWAKPAPKPKPDHGGCRPATSARCLRKARGAEPVALSATGRISRVEALQAFVQTVGPLPGVKRLPGAVAPAASTSASGPLRWAASYLHAMTHRQRAAFSALISLHPNGRRARLAAKPPKAVVKKWTTAADTARTRIAQHMGVTLGLPISIALMPVNDATEPQTHADAAPINTQGDWAPTPGPGVRCRIRVYPVAWQDPDPDRPTADVSHEVMHCFQYKLNPKTYGSSTETWLLEGGAEWGGDQIGREVLGRDPHDPLLKDYWIKYLTSPEADLFIRTYTAVGVFAHLAETSPGQNLWPTLKTMFQAPDQASAYDAGVPDSNTDFLDTWASSYARNPSLGPGWDTTGVGITATKPAIPTYGGSVTLAAGPRANALARLQLGGQVLELTDGGGPAFGRLRDSGGTTYSLDDAAYCVDGDQCTCPDGTPGAAEQLPPIASGVAWAAVTGSDHATKVAFTRTSTSAWCQHPVGGLPRTGNSNMTVGGAANGIGTDHGANDGCTIHQQSVFPPGVEIQCLFEISETGTGAIGQLSFSTFHYTGPGVYEVTARGSTVGPDIDYGDVVSIWAATEMPPDQEAGAFTISKVTANTVTGSLSATMEDVDSPEQDASLVGAGGSFTVPLDTAP